MRPGSRIMGFDMAHSASSIFFFGVLTGLAVLLERIVRDNGPAIRQALQGARIPVAPRKEALDHIGSCLRASFPTRDQDALGPDLGRLLRQLGSDASSRAQYA